MDNHLIPDPKTLIAINLFIANVNPFELNFIEKFVQNKIHLNIMGESSSLFEAFEQCQKLSPHVLLINEQLLFDEMIWIKNIKFVLPDMKVLILANQESVIHLIDALGQGADGIFLTSDGCSELDDLCDAILRLTRGEIFIHSHLTSTFIQYFRTLYEGFKPLNEQQVLELRNDQEFKNKFEAPTLFHITQREIEILQLIAEGKNNKQIAKQLLISEKTVKNHVSNILFKSNLKDRTQALIFAIRHGWVTLK